MNNLDLNNKQGANKEGSAKNKSNVTIVIIAVIFFLFLLSLAIESISTNNSSNNQNNSSQEIVPQEYIYALGEKVNYDGLEIQIYRWSFEIYFCGIEPPKQTGETLVVVDVKLTNTTNKTKTLIDGVLFKNHVYCYSLIFNEEYSYDQSYKKYADFLSTYEEISPLQTINASLCFIVPTVLKTDTNKELKIKFQKNTTVNIDSIHYWILREKTIETQPTKSLRHYD